MKIGGQQRVVASTTGSTTIGVYDTGGNLVRGIEQGVYGPGSDATDRTGTVNLFESVSIGRLLPAGRVRRREPRLETLRQRRYPAGRRESRALTLYWIALIIPIGVMFIGLRGSVMMTAAIWLLRPTSGRPRPKRRP